MDANGRKWGAETAETTISVRKQELFMKTGWERAFIVFSCVSCFPAWVVGSDGCRDTAGWANPPYRWERENQFRMLDIECRSGGGSGGPEQADFGPENAKIAVFRAEKGKNSLVFAPAG